MAIIRPFCGYRPRPDLAASVASRPYDVLTSEEARHEVEGNPLSFLHVGKPEVDLPRGVDPESDAVYARGKHNLRKLIDDGVLLKDPAPCFYAYRLTMGVHSQLGLGCCLSVEEYHQGVVLKHEHTRPDKELDRTRHMLESGAQTGPILVAYRSDPVLDTILENVVRQQPLVNFTSADGIRHELWVMNNPSLVRSIQDRSSAIRTLYIADGHHRTAAAARAAATLQSENRKHTGNEEYNFFLAVIFPHDQLRILDYNRLVRDLRGLPAGEFLEKVGSRFMVRESPQPVTPSIKGEFGMYFNSRWYRLSLNGKLQQADLLGLLDVNILQHSLLDPILGIADPRTDKRIEFVGGIRGLGELEKRVDSGEMAVGFSFYPTSLEELFAVADAGKVMPPKSTWFEPKLRDGMLVHMLE